MVPSSSGSSFVGLLNPKYEGCFEMSDTCPVTQCSIPEALIFRHVVPFHMTVLQLTLRLLILYIYGAPSKARNANVVYIWTYVWQR